MQNDVNEATGIVVRGLLKMSVIVDESSLTYKDNLTYQWYNSGTQNGEEILVAVPGATSFEYTPVVGGTYKCIVTNTYKGHSASVNSFLFGVVA